MGIRLLPCVFQASADRGVGGSCSVRIVGMRGRQKNLDAPCYAAAARAGSWITMLQWETVDENATYPFERYRAVSGSMNTGSSTTPPGQQAKTSRGFWWSGRSRRVASRRTSTTAPTAPSTGRSKPPSNGKARHPKQDDGRESTFLAERVESVDHRDVQRPWAGQRAGLVHQRRAAEFMAHDRDHGLAVDDLLQAPHCSACR